MTKNILLLDYQFPLYFDKLSVASADLPDDRTVASVQYLRKNLDQIPDIAVCTTEILNDDLTLEMYRRGAAKIVIFDEDSNRLKESIMKNG